MSTRDKGIVALWRRRSARDVMQARTTSAIEPPSRHPEERLASAGKDPRRPPAIVVGFRPRTVLVIIGVVILAWFILDRSWIRGNGIVAGELTAKSPIVQARLERLFVKCLDHVSKGQRLAEFYNEAMVQLAGQELQQLQFQLAQARAEIEIADREAQAAQKTHRCAERPSAAASRGLAG